VVLGVGEETEEALESPAMFTSSPVVGSMIGIREDVFFTGVVLAGPNT
jgi:hypothetical protein